MEWLDRKTKADQEDIEHALDFRSEGKGADVRLFPSNMSDDEISDIFDGSGMLVRLPVVVVSSSLYLHHSYCRC
jgi:hypothetical protein